MRQRLLSKLQQQNVTLDALLQELSSQSHEQLNRQPNPQSWSATQVLHHLILAEKGARLYCEKKLSFEPDLPKAGLKTKWRIFMTKMYFLSPLKAKAPKIVGTEVLPKEDSLENIVQLWKKERLELAKFLENMPERYLDREIFKHIAGRFSLDGMMQFFEAHFNLHRKQIYRALKGKA